MPAPDNAMDAMADGLVATLQAVSAPAGAGQNDTLGGRVYPFEPKLDNLLGKVTAWLEFDSVGEFGNDTGSGPNGPASCDAHWRWLVRLAIWSNDADPARDRRLENAYLTATTVALKSQAIGNVPRLAGYPVITRAWVEYGRASWSQTAGQKWFRMLEWAVVFKQRLPYTRSAEL